MNVWNALPLFRLLLPFVLGVLVATFTEVQLNLWQLLLVFLGFFFLFRFTFKFRYRWVFGVYVSIAVFAFSLLWTSIHPFKTQANYFEQYLSFLAEPIAWLLKWALSALLGFVQWVQSLPQVLSSGIDISIAETYLLYGLLFFLAFSLVKKEGRWLVYSLSLLLLLTAWDTYEDYEQAQQRELLLYRLNKHTAIAFIQGREAVVLMDAVLLQDESKQRFHLMHHWWNRGLNVIDKRSLTDSVHTDFLLKTGRHIQFADKRMLLLDANYQQQTAAFPITVDFVLLTGSLNYYQKQKWERECEVLGLNCPKLP